MVLACDGIWDCLTNQEVATFIRSRIVEGISLKEICERLMDHCLAEQTGTGGVGCDNMTVEIVAFLNGQTEEQWYQKIDRTSDLTVKCATSVESEDVDLKKLRGLQSESRQYSVEELKNSPDLTSSLTQEEN